MTFCQLQLDLNTCFSEKVWLEIKHIWLKTWNTEAPKPPESILWKLFAVMVMACIDSHNVHDCVMSQHPTARRLSCRFPYNQMVKISAWNCSKQTEVSAWIHKWGNNSSAARLIVTLNYWWLSSAWCVQNILWLKPGVHHGWSPTRREHPPSIHHFLFILPVKKYGREAVLNTNQGFRRLPSQSCCYASSPQPQTSTHLVVFSFQRPLGSGDKVVILYF